MTNFDKVCEYISNAKGTDVRFGQITSYMGHRVNRIFIHHNFNTEKNGLFALLHECGHAFQPDPYVGINEYMKFNEKSKEFAEGQYRNEVDAWETGEKIAKELKLDIDWKGFYSLKKEALETYK